MTYFTPARCWKMFAVKSLCRAGLDGTAASRGQGPAHTGVRSVLSERTNDRMRVLVSSQTVTTIIEADGAILGDVLSILHADFIVNAALGDG